jgi:hypothetical protein
MLTKELFGFLSGTLTFVSYAPYFWGIKKGRIKPHIFTWLIWGLATGIVCAAQYSAGAGSGAWATGFTCFLTLIIIAIAFSRSEKNITRSDWGAFLGALAAIPAWYFTSAPLTAVVLVTGIDGIAYYPTFRKSVTKPYEEAALFYGLSNLKHVCSLLATESYSWTTTLYPAVLLMMNSLLIGLLLWRRFVLKEYGTHLRDDPKC